MPGASASPTIAELTVADDPGGWTAAGFTVDAEATSRVGTVRLRFAGPSKTDVGVTGWTLRGVTPGVSAIDGFPTSLTDDAAGDPGVHANGATHIDHLVLLTPRLDRTMAALARIGLSERRRRDHTTPAGAEVHQAFVRLGDVVLEVVAPRDAPMAGDRESGGDRPARAFGITVEVPDLGPVAELVGEALSEVRPAVQEGRSIATLRHRRLGLTTAVAFMTPDPRRR